MANLYSQSRTRNVLQCRHCGHFAMARASRHGFWRGKLLPLFGVYPWQCMTCGAQMLLRDRGLVDQRVWSHGNSVSSANTFQRE